MGQGPETGTGGGETSVGWGLGGGGWEENGD